MSKTLVPNRRTSGFAENGFGIGVKRVALSRPIAVVDGKNLVLAVVLAAADKGRDFQERAQPIKKSHHIQQQRVA